MGITASAAGQMSAVQSKSHDAHIGEHFSNILFAKLAKGLNNGLSCAAHLQQDRHIVHTLREALQLWHQRPSIASPDGPSYLHLFWSTNCKPSKQVQGLQWFNQITGLIT